ncbi:MAG: hypothetical protein JNK74_27585 [Candidatus Hydrogenedentes bacterium]|nr:hypothetical protein [Candidatus Hydrogenedentota bacterium]
MSEPEVAAETATGTWAHPRAARLAIIFAVLYGPQSWYFAMDYAWNDYRLFWLMFFPGLPAFFPTVLITQVNAIPLAIVSWTLTALIASRLYRLSCRSPHKFKWTSAAVFVWSVISAFGAYAVFRH